MDFVGHHSVSGVHSSFPSVTSASVGHSALLSAHVHLWPWPPSQVRRLCSNWVETSEGRSFRCHAQTKDGFGHVAPSVQLPLQVSNMRDCIIYASTRTAAAGFRAVVRNSATLVGAVGSFALVPHAAPAQRTAIQQCTTSSQLGDSIR